MGQDQDPWEPLTDDWKRFALICFALVMVAVVVGVYLVIRGDLARMM